MASTKAIKFNSIALIMCIALCAPILSMAVLTCCDLKPTFAACESYARHGGECVSQDCCFEALNLKNHLINSHQDYITACHCIQDAAVKMIPNINYTAFSILPDRCGIRLPFNFKVDMNCDKVSTDNETQLEAESQRKAGGIEVSLHAAGKDLKRRKLLRPGKMRSTTIVIISNNSANSTTSSSTRMHDPSLLIVQTCLVTILEALIISLGWL